MRVLQVLDFLEEIKILLPVGIYVFIEKAELLQDHLVVWVLLTQLFLHFMVFVLYFHELVFVGEFLHFLRVVQKVVYLLLLLTAELVEQLL